MLREMTRGADVALARRVIARNAGSCSRKKSNVSKQRTLLLHAKRNVSKQRTLLLHAKRNSDSGAYCWVGALRQSMIFWKKLAFLWIDSFAQRDLLNTKLLNRCVLDFPEYELVLISCGSKICWSKFLSWTFIWRQFLNFRRITYDRLIATLTLLRDLRAGTRLTVYRPL